MIFNSDAKQDQFVFSMYNGRKNGTFIDIGSCGAISSNNTYTLECLGWRGACIEIEKSYESLYANRSCLFINKNALSIDYKELITSITPDNIINYLSMDIDTLSYECLTRLPFDECKFGVITIEHDAYIYGETYRGQQRDFLLKKGYKLLCSNVFVEQEGYQYGLPFEDWWVHPSLFDSQFLDKIACDSKAPSEILSRFV